jgi:hypothetical protein
MINPAEIPRIDGDMDELAQFADGFEITGYEVADTGARIHRNWQGLAAVYDSPDAGELFAATGPVQSGSASVGEDLGSAAAALREYATETAGIQSRLEAMRREAVGLVDAYAIAPDESTTVDLEGRGVALSAAVEAQIAAWEAAQLRCANALRALTGVVPYSSYDAATTPLGYGGEVLLTPPAPVGATREIFPVDPIPPVSTTGHPPVVIGPGLLINVPAPPVTGTADGPGSLLPVPGGSIVFDTALPPDPGIVPEPPAPTPEERRGTAQGAILGPDGQLPGVPGSGRDVREVPREEFEEIEKGIREGLGEPDKVVPIAGKGTLEIWQISPTERIVYRDFSTSGAQGQGAHETIDVHDVKGLDGVRRIHIPGG